MNMGRFLIFGANGGLGQAIAEALAADGHGLHLAGRSAEPVMALAARLGASATIADVREASSFARVAAEAGPVLDGLVYAVGTINLKPVGRLTDADFLTDFEINALGAVRAVQAALPALKASTGTASVLLFSTVAVAQGFAAHASVSMAKGAVEGLTRALAAELAPKIRVNAIAPSLTRTPLAAAMTGNEAMAKAIAAMHPLSRLGEPADMAGLARVLLTDAGSWITGQVIGIDGGRATLRSKG
jgi:NAD(P)-dependent dehydrogenase (short-subunit alcohol dehydrogenase family)